jgi:hypothetical protein
MDEIRVAIAMCGRMPLFRTAPTLSLGQDANTHDVSSRQRVRTAIIASHTIYVPCAHGEDEHGIFRANRRM